MHGVARQSAELPRHVCWLATLAVAIPWLLSGCVDTTPPWEKVKAAGGTGGLSTGGVGGLAIDGPTATGGSQDVGARGAIDVGGGGSGGAIGGVGGALDAPSLGGMGGGVDAGAGSEGGMDGGPAVDLPLPGIDGTIVPIDAQPDVPPSGSGGIIGAGGTLRTGGATGSGGNTGSGGISRTGGVSGTGGKTGTGGTTATGGTTTPDAGPDVALDLPVDANSLLVGLEVYYPCQSVSGTATLPDMSGKEHHGTLSIGTGGAACSGAGYTFDPGRTGNGNALTLIKAGCGYVSMPAAIFANATDITIAFLVNVKASQPWQRVLDVGVNSGLSVNPNTGTKYMNLLPTNNPNGLVFAITNNGFTSEQKLSTTGLSAGVWTHLAVVLSSGQGRLYVNGTLAAGPSAILRPADLGNIDYAFIGKSGFPADPMFDGQVDEFRVYSRALSDSEVLALSQFAGE